MESEVTLGIRVLSRTRRQLAVSVLIRWQPPMGARAEKEGEERCGRGDRDGEHLIASCDADGEGELDLVKVRADHVLQS